MAGLVVHVETVEHDGGVLVAVGRLDRRFDVPFDDLAVEKQRGIGIALVVEAGVQRSETEFRLRHHRLARIVEPAVEPFQHQIVLDHRAGRRKLARAHVEAAVGADVDAVRVLRDGYVAGQGGLRIGIGRAGAVHHRHLRVTVGLELAVLDRLLDPRDMEEQAGVALGRHHVLVLHRHLGVVLVGGGELAVVGAGDEVAVAVDQHLPAHVHGVGVDAGEQRAVLVAGVEVAAVVGQRDRKLGAAEHARGVVDRRIDRVALVGKGAVEALDVRDLGDPVAFHRVESDAGQAAVDLVIDEGIAAVVGAVGVRLVHVVGVATDVLRPAVRPRAEHRLRFVGDAPAHQAVLVEYRDGLQQAARRQAVDAHVAVVSAAAEIVVRVEFARCHLDRRMRHRRGGGRLGGRLAGGRRGRFLTARGEPGRHAGTGEPGQRRRVEKTPALQIGTGVGLVLVIVTHLASSFGCGRKVSKPRADRQAGPLLLCGRAEIYSDAIGIELTFGKEIDRDRAAGGRSGDAAQRCKRARVDGEWRQSAASRQMAGGRQRDSGERRKG